YALQFQGMTGITGWKDAWKSTWTEPGTGLTGHQVTMRNLFGTTDPQEIDDDLSIDSLSFVAPPPGDPPRGLADEGTGVVLRISSHDAYRPYSYAAQYVDRLRAAGIPVHVEIYYRAGHLVSNAALPGDLELLNMVFDDESLTTETEPEHFARNPADYTQSIAFSPSHIPLTYETPIEVGAGQTHTWSFV